MPTGAILLDLFKVLEGALYPCLSVIAKEAWPVPVEKLTCPDRHSGHLLQSSGTVLSPHDVQSA